MDIKEKLIQILGEENVKINEPMDRHITFEVGGPADYYVTPESLQGLTDLIAYLREAKLPFYIIGKGSNLLVRDGGYRGVVVELLKLNDIKVEGEQVRAQAGAVLKDVAERALDAGLSGYEFASGIPGTIGGAIRMNAGAYDGEHKMVVDSVTVLDENGNVTVLDNADCHFGYRHSVVQEKPLIVLESTLKLEPGDKKEIREKMQDLKTRREQSQPLEYPSAGSTFKRPDAFYVGPTLTELGLKGKMIGGAQVSTKHAGFVINKDHATATDILELIALIQKTVREEKDTELREEVIVIGEEN